jgi:hypothetical protein
MMMMMMMMMIIIIINSNKCHYRNKFAGLDTMAV